MIEIRPMPHFGTVFEQLRELHRAHWNETETYRGREFGPRYDLLEHYWQRGLVRAWGAFDGDRLIGQLTTYLSTSVHTGEQILTEDTLFVLPEYRKGVGSQLIDRCIADAKANGIAEIWATCKPATRVGPMLERKGMAHVANVHHIRLGSS